MSDDKNELEHILQSPTKNVHSAKGVLSKLYRQMLQDLGVTPMVWQRLMDRYLRDPRNGIAEHDGTLRSSTRGNLKKALGGPKMTWKSFMEGIRLLAPVSAEFSIKLTWSNPTKKPTIHSYVLDLNSPDGGEIDNDGSEENKNE